MAIKGVMTINGRSYTNHITEWGLQSLYRAMFEDVPFPTDLYLIVAGIARGITAYPGEPYPYSYPDPIEHDPDTLGAYIGTVLPPIEPTFWIPYNTTDWDADGNPITPGFPPKTPTSENAYFEYGQSTPTRLKVTPFNFDGARVWTEQLEFNCPEVVNTGGNPGDITYFFLTDSPTLYNNNSRLFNVVLVHDFDTYWAAHASFPPTNSFSEGARFSYSFTLT